MTDTSLPAPAGSAGGDPVLRVRALTEPDLTSVLDLWSGYVTEGFADNFAASGTDAADTLEYQVSMDRWGPGIAMPMLPGAPRPHMPREPSYEVAKQIAAMIGNPRFRCLVADVEGVLVGFVAYSIRPLPSAGNWAGSIDELFVDPVARRAGIGQALVEAATSDLRAQDIGVFHALVPKGKRYYPARKLFGRLGWERDLVAFGRYE